MLIIYLSLPIFYHYDKNKIEKIVCNGLNVECLIQGDIKYNFFPSPRLNINNVEILDFSKKFKNIGSAEKLILKIPFKTLVNLKTLDFDSAEIVNADINLETLEIDSLIDYLNNKSHKKLILQDHM